MHSDPPARRRIPATNWLVAGAIAVAVLFASTIGWFALSSSGKPTNTAAAAPAGTSAGPASAAAPSASASAAPSATRSSSAPRPSSTSPSARITTGFPSASSTGVPAGTSLRTLGEVTVTKAGTVLDGVRAKCILIWASNVTVRRSLVRGGNCGSDHVIEVSHGATNAHIEDTEIDAAYVTPQGAALGGSNFTCLRCNIHGAARGVQIGDNVVLQDSYVHDLYGTANSENSAFVSNGGQHVVVNHCTLEQNTVPTGGFALALIPDYGVLNDILVENNLFNGGTYAVWAGDAAADKNPAWRARNTRFINNAFGRKFFPRSGYYGPAAAFATGVPGNVWSGNHWVDNHKSIPTPGGA
jgi:hypothetical protein